MYICKHVYNIKNLILILHICFKNNFEQKRINIFAEKTQITTYNTGYFVNTIHKYTTVTHSTVSTKQ